MNTALGLATTVSFVWFLIGLVNLGTQFATYFGGLGALGVVAGAVILWNRHSRKPIRVWGFVLSVCYLTLTVVPVPHATLLYHLIPSVIMVVGALNDIQSARNKT